MLSVAALNAPSVAMNAIMTPTKALLNVFSPNKHPFMKRMIAVPSHFSFDPYKTARAQMMMSSLAQKVLSPVKVVAPIAAAPVVVSAPTVTVRVGASTAAAHNFRVVAIAFKQGICNYRAPFRVVEGDIVIVEGDRGEHIGTIKSVFATSETDAMAETVTSKIIRRATAADVEAFEAKKAKEATCLEEVTKIAKELRLNASIADVEFQLDNNKLTIFVERASSSTFVDFRKVQRTLFKMFHCRIWFVYMDELSN